MTIQFAFDIESTGLFVNKDRIIEIGCVEIKDRCMTGNSFHRYVNPECEIDPGAFAVHGLSSEFLRDKPKFNEIFDELLNFIKGGELIIHNAPFDVGFVNYELSLLGHEQKVEDYCSVFDTLPFARQRHPGQKNSLDALCKRYEIDNTHRERHGALLDAELLARVYLAMTGGQDSLFADTQTQEVREQANTQSILMRNQPLPVMSVSSEEEKEHLAFLSMLKAKSGVNLWEED